MDGIGMKSSSAFSMLRGGIRNSQRAPRKQPSGTAGLQCLMQYFTKSETRPGVPPDCPAERYNFRLLSLREQLPRPLAEDLCHFSTRNNMLESVARLSFM